jgi:predicted XRE-type DNA-binding protein
MSIVIERHIKQQGWTQKEAATRLGVTQPRISNLMRGRLDLFSLDSLAAMLALAGIQIELNFKDAA